MTRPVTGGKVVIPSRTTLNSSRVYLAILCIYTDSTFTPNHPCRSSPTHALTHINHARERPKPRPRGTLVLTGQTWTTLSHTDLDVPGDLSEMWPGVGGLGKGRGGRRPEDVGIISGKRTRENVKKKRWTEKVEEGVLDEKERKMREK